MKKLILLTIISVFSLISFASVLEFVPEDSKATVYINNLSKTYESLKTVPTIKSFLLDPFQGEILISNYVEMFLESIQVKPDEFFAQLETDMVLFVQKPDPNDELYLFGGVFGPIKQPDKFLDAFKKIIEPLSSSGLSFTSINKEINGEKYVILVQDRSVYNSVEKNKTSFNAVYENGIYFKIDSSEMENEGYAYVKDKVLIGKADGYVDEKAIKENYIQQPQDYNFFGTIFASSGLVPKEISSINDLVNIVADSKLVERILESSQGFELNADLNIETTQQQSMNINQDSYIKVNSSIPLDSIIPIMEENDIKYKRESENKISFIIDTNSDDVVVENVNYNLWKENNIIYISEMDNERLNEKLSNSSKLSENILFKELSQKIGYGNLMVLFLDISKFMDQYVGVQGQYGLLLNIDHLGERRIESDFILK
ncbi:hypothetical protein [Geotoga petraea]|uniref:DUF3352 domain-containing protein n=1 Tax=Geotoga petraea TaxID=28234 RepID=A0A4Z0W2N5_9BACT|nr:hypothetical protein [Geotoga petraea]TGG87560.1 hypothetical protein E4650_07385 [Geotoga petraea]